MSIEQYRRFRRALKSTPCNGRVVEYKWGSLPEMLDFSSIVYGQMFEEFSLQIANAINQLTDYTHRLKAWSGLLVHMDDKEKLSVAHEFIDPVATVALNLPYVIRSRFIFASAHLCHQANRVQQKALWKDDLPADKEIYFPEADKYGGSWRQYNKFKQAVEKIGAKDYQAATGDFRHAYNHRIPIHVVVGQAQIAIRQIDVGTGRTWYVLGGSPALTVEVATRLLADQCRACYLAFEAFQKLVKEHEACFVPTIGVT